MANDPCACVNATVVVTPTPCTTSNACCLKACNALIYGADSVGPCSQVGQFDLTTLSHTLTGCSGTVTYSLESEDGLFTNVSVTSVGILSWTTGDETTVDQFGEINFRITCTSDCNSQDSLNAVGYVKIQVKNLCNGVVCDPGNVCDLCDGTCVAQTIDIVVE